MINLSTLVLSSEVSGPGGLFDFDLTLPIVAIQFVILTIVLNIILYSPLIKIIEEREEYILDNLGKASELISETNILTSRYEKELAIFRKQSQLEITNSQKIHKEILEIQVNLYQKQIDSMMTTIINDFETKKVSLQKDVNGYIPVLSDLTNDRFFND